MADETIIAKTEETIAKAADAVVTPVVDAAEKVAPKAVRKVRAKVAKVRAKRAPAKVIDAVAKTNRKAVKAAKRTTRSVAATATKSIEGTTTMTNEFNKLFAGFELPGADRFQTLFADAGEKGRDALAKSRGAAEEFTGVAKANVEAIVEAGKIAVAGAKSIGEELVESGRGGLETATADMKTLAGATSPTDFFQLQGEIVRASFDRFVATSSQLTERVVKLAGEAAEPIQARASINAERIKELMA